jgi:sterol desaturase/sphingolipid hydroxylase (fatty acid hydroxylase superfamily)
VLGKFDFPFSKICRAGLPFVAGPLLFGCHMVTYLIWTFVMMLESAIAHSGYDFWFLKWIQDARIHAYHHSHYADNYGSYFGIWDKLMGTDLAYKEHERKRKEKLLKQQGM